jgi:hypothetical protein
MSPGRSISRACIGAPRDHAATRCRRAMISSHRAVPELMAEFAMIDMPVISSRIIDMSWMSLADMFLPTVGPRRRHRETPGELQRYTIFSYLV